MTKLVFSRIVVSIVLLTVILAAAGAPLLSQEKKPEIYNPGLDVKAALAKALEQAIKENKHVVLFFGANWCPWCHRLHGVMNSDVEIKKFLNDHYLVIMVDIGEKKGESLNGDLVDHYKVKGMGYPAMAVLDQRGVLICAQSSGVLEKGKSHDPERVLAFFKAQAPQPK